MFSWKERARYAFDNTLSKGTIALIAWLAIVSAVGVMLIAAVVVLTGTGPADQEPGSYSFIEAAWGNLMRTFDAGNMADDAGWMFRILMLIVTLFGIFVLSTLIGVLSAGLESQLDNLRKGRSKVVETDHTVILGWSEQIFPILTELIEANKSKRRACIVVLGAKDKVEMEDEIRDKVEDTATTRIVCRTGSPIELGDLQIASINSARSIILLAPDKTSGETNDPDVDVIKGILAITNNPNRKKEPYHVVAEIRDPKNFEVARMVGKDEVEIVLVGNLIARVMAQTCRQSGLSVVYQELLDFGGDEIYFKEEPAFFGRTYAETLFAYNECSVLGLHKKGGVPVVNPKGDTPIGPGDRVIVVAQDDDAVKISAPPAPDMSSVALSDPPATQPEKTLLLGWNWRATSVINELDNYVTPGSTVVVVTDASGAADDLKRECGALKRQGMKFHAGDITDRRLLDALHIQNYDHVIVLCDDQQDVQQADARTLITLLHLRDIAQKTGKHVSIVSEMLDMKNRTLAEVTNADDFIVSDRLVSLMLSQISENKALNMVFSDLFSPEGSELYLKPASSYVKLGVPMNYSTVVAAAAQRGQSAIGYKIAALSSQADKSYGVAVNPMKNSMVTFGPQDKIIVAAED